MNPQEWTSLEIVAEGDDEDELEEEEEDEDDEDDDVGTDERGQEMLRAPETAAEPDVSSDRRVPADAVTPRDSPAKARKAPLAIKEIEELEDDAPGG
jgi:hypothetical protein